MQGPLQPRSVNVDFKLLFLPCSASVSPRLSPSLWSACVSSVGPAVTAVSVAAATSQAFNVTSCPCHPWWSFLLNLISFVSACLQMKYLNAAYIAVSCSVLSLCVSFVCPSPCTTACRDGSAFPFAFSQMKMEEMALSGMDNSKMEVGCSPSSVGRWLQMDEG